MVHTALATTTVNIDVNEVLDQMLAGDSVAVAGVAVAGTLLLVAIIALILGQILAVIGRWKTIKKLGGEGWSQVIPVYSEWAMSRAAGCTMALCVAVTVLDLITFFQGAITADWFQYIAGACTVAFIVVRCVYLYKVCQRFGKDGVGFALGLVILPFIFWMILGCGSAQPVDEK